MKRSLILSLLLAVTLLARAQDRTVSGKVVAAKTGEALPNVTISVPALSLSAVSDKDGSFSISLPAKPVTISVAAVGYVTAEKVLTAGETTVSFSLKEDPNKLDEVVIVGYSAKKKGELTSAVTVVDEKALKDVTSNNIGSMLQGKVAGLQVVNSSGVPGSAPEIRLRGVSSVNATQSPLTVIDGVIGGNYDPNDVESVTVLKDAGATAMYGSQANGGVIIITTKRGKTKKVSYSAKVTTGFRKPDFGKMKMMNGSQLYNYQKELYRDYVPGDTGNSYKIDILKFYNERPLSLRDQNYSWLNTIFNTAFIQNHYFSIAGKTDNHDYYISASYYNEDGTFMNTNYKRLNLRANSTSRLGKAVTLTNNINISANNGKSYDYNDIYYAYLNMPWDNPYDSAGNPRYVDGNSTFKWWSRDKINPVHTIKNSNHPYKGYDVNYDAALDIKITNWLTFSTSNRLAAAYNASTNYFSPDVAGTYHGTGYLDESSTLAYGIVSNDLLKFNYKFGDHTISGLAGFAYEDNKTELLSGTGKGLPQGLSTLNVVSSNITVGGSNSETTIQSLLSQVNYSYKNKYYVTGSFRRDGSSNFPKTNRYASFPSISGAWVASNEAFFHSNVVDNLRFRASYGITGTQDIGAARYLGLYSLSTQYNSTTAATPSQLPSPNLTWESKQQVNAGFDISLWKRIAITVDVYSNLTKNLLLQVAQPLSVGFEQRWENAGQVKNKGIEIGLNTVNVRTRNFEWNTDFNINFNDNKLQKLPSQSITTGSWSISQIYRNGGNLYEFYMPKWAGVDKNTGAPLWEKITTDGNGVTKKETTSTYADATSQEAGSALPKFQGGITNRFSYKSFSLSVNAYYLSGNKVFSNNLRFVMNDGSEPYMNQIVLPKGYSIWTKPGDNATNPSPENNANSTETSTRYLMNGSYLAIRNITLSYNVPDAVVHRMKLEGLTFSVSADNVHTFTKFIGQDPQTTITPGASSLPGVSDFKYPNNRQFLFNVNLKF